MVTSDPVPGLSKQIIEVQDLGLPCGWDFQGSTGIGVPVAYLSLAHLYNDSTASTHTIDGWSSKYYIANVSSFLDTVLGWVP